jgi:hypothetical protein
MFTIKKEVVILFINVDQKVYERHHGLIKVLLQQFPGGAEEKLER